jgi:hypothetical protein
MPTHFQIRNPDLYLNSTELQILNGSSKPANYGGSEVPVRCSSRTDRRKSNTSPKTLDRDRVEPRKGHEIKQIRGGDVSYQALGSTQLTAQQKNGAKMWPDSDQSSRHNQLQCPPLQQLLRSQNSAIGGEISRNPRNRSKATRSAEAGGGRRD